MAGAAAKPKSASASKPQTAQSPQSGTPAGTIGDSSNAQALQNLIGNQAMGRLLGSARAQAKLSVNAPGDRFEAEADRVAESVMRKPVSAEPPCKCGRCESCGKGVSAKPVSVQRWSASPMHGGTAPASVGRVLARSGSPLPRTVRGDMESRFGHDFSSVRVHTDNDAARSARELSANAYTVGDHIVFGAGRFAPHSPGGGHLLAHELTHVLQQQGGVARQVQRDDIEDPATTKLSRELIPTATLQITVEGALFILNAEATFQIADKTYQMMRIALNQLLGEQYSEKVAIELAALISGKAKLERSGHFQDKRDAFEGEKIDRFHFNPVVFDSILGFLSGKGLEVKLDDQQREQLKLGMGVSSIWADLRNFYSRRRTPMPLWLNELVFTRLLMRRPEALSDFAQEFARFRATGDQDALVMGASMTGSILRDVFIDLTAIESFREDAALYEDPTTQAAYEAIWAVTDQHRKAKKPADVLRGLVNLFAFLDFMPKHPDLQDRFNWEHVARRELLARFVDEQGLKADNTKQLPPYTAFIVAPDLNDDHTTVTTAKNMFRMVNEIDQLHGGPLIHGVTIAMKRTIKYSWEVVPLPDSLKFMKEHGTKAETLVKESDSFVKNSPQNIPAAIKSYDPDEDRDQTIKMGDLGIGSYLLVGHAAPRYATDMNWIQQPGSAGFPFFVFDAKTLAHSSTYAEWDGLQNLKKQAAETKDEKEKKTLDEEVARLETREASSLGAVAGKDLKDTQKLIDAATGLRKYIEADRAQNKSAKGDANTDPFIVRLKNEFPALHDVYLMIREMYDPRRYDDFTAIDEYLKILEGQKKQLKELGERVADADGRFKENAPSYRVVAAMVKEDDGNAVPLLLVAGHHPDSVTGKYKIKLVDVTFKNNKMKDMIYVGKARETEEEAMKSAFDQFADDSHYGDGQVVWRVPAKGWNGVVKAEDNFWDYLQYAIAALGIIMLVMGTIASAGLLSPVAAAVVTAIGVGLAVVGAAMSIRNMQKRDEQGVLEMDTETALDIINIIGAVVMVIGTVTKVSAALRTATMARTLMIQRLERLIAVYDITEIGANIYLTAAQVKEDVDAINKMEIPQHEKDSMMSSVIFDAVQQGAMMSISIHGTLKGIPDTFRTRVEHTPYKSWQEKGWISVDKNNKVTIHDAAPPFLKQLRDAPDKPRLQADQGETARRATIIEPVHATRTRDGEHELTLTERGRIIRCSDYCQDLRARYQKMLERDPDTSQKLLVIEGKAAKAAADGDKAAAKSAMEEATGLEDSLRAAEAQWLKMTGESDLATPKIELTPLGTVKTGPDGVKIEPIGGGNPARKLDVVDFMTSAEQAAPGGMQMALDRLGTVLGRPLTDIPVFRQHWDAAVGKALGGKSPKDLPVDAIFGARTKAMKEFWGLVSQDPKAVKLLNAAGFEVDAKGAAAKLGPAGKDKAKNESAKRERRVDVGWRKDSASADNPFDASGIELTFRKPVAESAPPARRTAPQPTGPAPKPALVLSPDEVRLQGRGRRLGMLQSEIDLMIQQYRKHGMSVNDMERQLDDMASPRQSNPNARSRKAPDYIMDPATKARLTDEDQKIAGTGGIQNISVRDDPGGGIAVTILGMILPRRLARRAADVTPTRRRAPDFNSSGKLFSNAESGLSNLWQRLHLWGPGFGDEAAAGMFWGPRDVNLKWQNESIENYIRDLALTAERHGMETHLKVTAVSWGDPTPSGFVGPRGERMLKKVEYTVTLKKAGEPNQTIRVTLEVNEPPQGGVKSFGIDPPGAVNLGDKL